MKRSNIVRVQLIILLALAVMVLYRIIAGPPPPDGLVVLANLRAMQLRDASFVLDADADEVVIRAIGSLNTGRMGDGLAAYAWVVRESDREVVWQMSTDRVERTRGTLVAIRGDTVALPAGRYHTYFSSFGHPSYRSDEWRRNARRWLFVLDVLDEDVPARILHDERREESEEVGGNTVWRAAPLEDEEEENYFFEVDRPVTLDVYAVGEIDPHEDGMPDDYSWIEDATDGARIWSLSRDNTEPAGGSASNRRFSGMVALEPGVYRAVAKTNRTHAYGHWRGAPPFDPGAWGITLKCEDPGAVRMFDPWVSLEPLISFTGVGDDENHYQRFRVTDRTSVVIHALGELKGDAYDYAELLEDLPTRRRTVWKMSEEESIHAGGGTKNRQAFAFITLDPSTYTLRYKSDGSHSVDGWNTDPPDYPERWGASLFTMSSGSIQLLDGGGEAPETPLSASVVDVGEPIVDWTQLGGDEEMLFAFALEDRARLHIVALGEISGSNRYDYGWITRDGEVVWEMTHDNTLSAGGKNSNRLFDGLIYLDPGEYVVHFKTDESHHFDDFDEGDPSQPEKWGLSVHYVNTDS